MSSPTNIVPMRIKKQAYNYQKSVVLIMIKEYSLEYLSELILQHYGFKGKMWQLTGYTDQNYAIEVEQEGKVDKYAVKISSKLENERLILLQNYVFKELAKEQLDLRCKFPRLIATLEGEDMLVESNQDGRNYIRVMTFIEGKEMWEIEDAPVHLFDQTGDIAAKLSLFLSRESMQSIGLQTEKQSQEHYFNICGFNPHFDKYYAYLDQLLKPIVAGLRTEFNEILPILATIPKQVVHNDICLSNLLVSHNSNQELFISGLIDFSSMIYTHRIIELVILCARSNLYKPDPLRNVFHIITAYNKVRKLTQAQKTVLFPMIKVRLAFLALLSSYLAAQKHHDPYFQKCKNGHISYLTIFTSACTNQQFLSHLQSMLQAQ